MKMKSIFFVLLVATFTGSSGCDPEEVCKSTYLADLAMEGFKSTFDYVDNNNKEYYSIAHTIVNFIGDINGCASNAQTAAPNQFHQQILFSKNASFSNPEQADEISFPLNELSPGASGIISDQLAFTQNGYYSFHTIADYTGVVPERNENNNVDDNPLERSTTAFSTQNVIHVTQASNKPVFDSTGNRVFLTRISTTIRYEQPPK